MKKILLSLGMLVVVGAVIIGATGAWFSDTEVSTGNTFTAGAIDLKIDSVSHYNGLICFGYDGGYQWLPSTVVSYNPQTELYELNQGADVADAITAYNADPNNYAIAGDECTGSWAIKDLELEKFFSFNDIKPGDEGENTISIHVENNDAWVCAEVMNLTDYENGQTEPELLEDNTPNQGELSSKMTWKVWRDDGDNIWQENEEEVLAEGNPTNGMLALYDSTTNTGALSALSTGYLGVAWTLPSTVGNDTQTDSLTGDVKFHVVQSRNNGEFKCSDLLPQ